MPKGILKLICRRDDSMHSLYFGIYDRQRSDCQMTDDGHTVIPTTSSCLIPRQIRLTELVLHPGKELCDLVMPPSDL